MSTQHVTEGTIQVIRNTLANYCIALDTKQYSLLNSVFAKDVKCNYAAVTPQHPSIQGVDAFIEKINTVLEGKRTQHGLTTQRLDFGDDERVCNALTYFTANTFSEKDGQLLHVTVFGYYEDILEEVEVGEWRIVERKVNMFVSFENSCSIYYFPSQR
jgi:hypothetical protein